MSDLLGMSFDTAASPSIRLRDWNQGEVDEHPTGWGFAWYPKDEAGAIVIKDPEPTGETALNHVLRDWDHFRGTAFVCHVRGAAKRARQEDTHPFLRSFGGRDWLCAHNGQLDPARLTELDLGSPPLFEPVGRSDTEHAFCWLLKTIRDAGARSLGEVGWEKLHGWLRTINELGTLNLILSDGLDLLAYRDRGGFHSLHWIRRSPPHESHQLANRVLELDLGNPLDASRSMVLVATTPARGGAWQELPPGALLVARRGAVIHEPGADAPAAGAPASAPSPRPPSQRHPTSRVLTVFHETVYRYQSPVERSTHIFRLRPVHDLHQQVLDHQLEVTPAGELHAIEDVFGNHTARMEIREPYQELRIVSRARVRVLRPPPLPPPSARVSIPLVWMPWQRQMMLPYLLPSELPETQLRELSDFAMSFAERQDHDLLDTLRDITEVLRHDFAYVSQSTNLETTPFEVYTQRRGVCQDFANLFICLARLLSVPARYRTGYIFTGANYANQIQSEASHAWVELYLPWAGWRGYDPTNGCLAGLDHVRVAVGRNYRDATPTSGTIYKGGEAETLGVKVRVEG